MENDIALLILNKRVTLRNEVQVACLPKKAVAEGTKCFATGWGLTKENENSQPTVLREVELPIYSQSACNSAYGGGITDVMICAGYKEGKKDSCQGDSGGPLVCENPVTKRFELRGVTSFGEGCARKGKPGVYARSFRYIKWIDGELQKLRTKDNEDDQLLKKDLGDEKLQKIDNDDDQLLEKHLEDMKSEIDDLESVIKSFYE